MHLTAAGNPHFLRLLINFGITPLLIRSAVEELDVDRHLLPEVDHLAVMNILLAAGADVGIQDEDDYTVLGIAASRGLKVVPKAVLGHGANVSASNGGIRGTAVHMAAYNDVVGVIDVLIEAGADIELRTSAERLTALGNATENGQHEAMRALLQRGEKTDVQDWKGDTLLHLLIACREHDNDDGVDAAVDMLLRPGVDETVVNNDGRTPLELMEFSPSEGGGDYSSEVERARLLLTRAPAWRGRCWLVMLYSRAWKAISADSSGTGGGSGHDVNAAGGGRGGGVPPSKMARNVQTVGGASGLLGQAGIERMLGAGGEGRSLRAVVGSLVELGCLRTVVGFS